MAIEFKLGNITLRLSHNSNHLTNDERDAINKVVPQILGYEDVDKLAQDHGFDSASELAGSHQFRSPRDFFLADGWQLRLAKYKNGVDK